MSSIEDRLAEMGLDLPAPLVAPDGRHVAVRLAAEATDSATGGVAVLDVRSRRWASVTDSDSESPTAWSPDGDVLLLAGADANNSDLTLSTWTYLRVEDDVLHSLRVPAAQPSFLLGPAG